MPRNHREAGRAMGIGPGGTDSMVEQEKKSRSGQELWDDLTQTVIKAVEAHQAGYQMVSRLRRKDGGYIWVQFSTRFADEYIDGYQVAYSVLTNIDDLVQMQRERSVTYENLPGFVAKYRIDWDLGMVLLDANARFME